MKKALDSKCIECRCKKKITHARMHINLFFAQTHTHTQRNRERNVKKSFKVVSNTDDNKH